jgi:hypothetical protein
MIFGDYFKKKFFLLAGEYGIYYMPFVFKEHKKQRKLVYLNHKNIPENENSSLNCLQERD